MGTRPVTRLSNELNLVVYHFAESPKMSFHNLNDPFQQQAYQDWLQKTTNPPSVYSPPDFTAYPSVAQNYDVVSSSPPATSSLLDVRSSNTETNSYSQTAPTDGSFFLTAASSRLFSRLRNWKCENGWKAAVKWSLVVVMIPIIVAACLFEISLLLLKGAAHGWTGTPMR